MLILWIVSILGITVQLTRKVFQPVILNSFGKNAVNCIHFELLAVKNLAAKYL